MKLPGAALSLIVFFGLKINRELFSISPGSSASAFKTGIVPFNIKPANVCTTTPSHLSLYIYIYFYTAVLCHLSFFALNVFMFVCSIIYNVLLYLYVQSDFLVTLLLIFFCTSGFF